MATPYSMELVIPGDGWVYVAPVDATPPTADAIQDMDLVDPVTAAPEWAWIGDTSYETPIEFEQEGGDATAKRTWARRNVRVIRDARTNSMTIASVNLSADLMALAFPGGQDDPTNGIYRVFNDGQTSQRAVLIVWQDGNRRGGLYFANVDLAGSFPTFDHEEFMEVPLAGTILSSEATPGFEWGPITKRGVVPADPTP